jgi:hypothetical protein
MPRGVRPNDRAVRLQPKSVVFREFFGHFHANFAPAEEEAQKIFVLNLAKFQGRFAPVPDPDLGRLAKKVPRKNFP